MEHHGLILAVLGLVLLSVEASSQGLETHSKERDVIYQADKFKCPFPFGTFSDPDDCAHFYKCIGGVPMHKKCGALKHFDIWRRVCLPFFIAICGNNKDKTKSPTVEPTATAIATTKSGGSPFTCPNFFGTFPNPDDCSKYYTCSFYRHTLKTCPENQLFDAVKNECKPKDKVNCGDRQNPLSLLTTAIPTETVPDVITNADTTTEKTTLEDITTHADTTTEEPTLEDITTIRDFPTGPPEHDCTDEDLDCIIDETGDVDNWFICPEDIGSYPHPSSDKLFIFCMNWIPSAKKCGQNLTFSRELSTCIEEKFL